LVIAAIGAALIVAVARIVVVGIAHDHAGAAAGPVAVAILVADQADLLYQVGVGVSLRDVDVRCPGAAGRQCSRAREQCDCECLHNPPPETEKLPSARQALWKALVPAEFPSPV